MGDRSLYLVQATLDRKLGGSDEPIGIASALPNIFRAYPALFVNVQSDPLAPELIEEPRPQGFICLLIVDNSPVDALASLRRAILTLSPPPGIRSTRVTSVVPKDMLRQDVESDEEQTVLIGRPVDWSAMAPYVDGIPEPPLPPDAQQRACNHCGTQVYVSPTELQIMEMEPGSILACYPCVQEDFPESRKQASP